MSDVPAMCAGCGTPLALEALRFAAITPEGQVDLVHDGEAGRCGPAIVAALVAAGAGGGMNGRAAELAHRLDTKLQAYADAVALLPRGDAPIDFHAMMGAYERRLLSWALRCAKGHLQRSADLLGLTRGALRQRLSRWRKRGGLVWNSYKWAPGACDAAVLTAVAHGHATSEAVIAAVVAPAHLNGLSKMQIVRRSLLRLTLAGALLRRGTRTHYRYAIAERGAA